MAPAPNTNASIANTKECIRTGTMFNIPERLSCCAVKYNSAETWIAATKRASGISGERIVIGVMIPIRTACEGRPASVIANAYHLAPTGFAPAFFMRMLYRDVLAVMNSVL